MKRNRSPRQRIYTTNRGREKGEKERDGMPRRTGWPAKANDVTPKGKAATGSSADADARRVKGG